MLFYVADILMCSRGIPLQLRMSVSQTNTSVQFVQERLDERMEFSGAWKKAWALVSTVTSIGKSYHFGASFTSMPSPRKRSNKLNLKASKWNQSECPI